MATAGIWNQHQASISALSGIKPSPMTGPASGSGSTGSTGSTSSTASSSGNSATISANDFLTLLVTEMQNQDPTADTDPNEYINQLVNVNSLEQLISINQTLTTAYPSSSSTSSTSDASASAASVKGKSASAQESGTANSLSVPAGAIASSTTSASGAGIKLGAGNLGVPDAMPAAQRVASALGGRVHEH
jgi:flagellar basal-body rod modification protein FlgD